jgi:hypothetical protein
VGGVNGVGGVVDSDTAQAERAWGLDELTPGSPVFLAGFALMQVSEGIGLGAWVGLGLGEG